MSPKQKMSSAWRSARLAAAVSMSVSVGSPCRRRWWCESQVKRAAKAAEAASASSISDSELSLELAESLLSLLLELLLLLLLVLR